MAIELWAAVDRNGKAFGFSHEPIWDEDLGIFNRKPGWDTESYFGDFLAAILCRDLKPGEKARVVSIDLANDVVVLDKPETVEQKFEKLKSAVFRWTRGDIKADDLVSVFREVANKEVQI